MTWRSKILLIVLFVVACFALIYFYHQLTLEKKLQADYEAIAQRVNELQKENALLEDELVKMENEKELERLARELYALKKPGEKAMIIPQEVMQKLIEENGIQSASPQAPSKISQWFQEIKHFFGNLF
jgi:cell division protein FtsB